MSGAAALSAAKRRRGGSGAPANSAAPSSAQGQAQGQAQGARVTPIEMLQQHNIRIAKLEAANTNTATATTGTNIEGVSQELMKRMDTLETSVADVVASKNNGNGNGEQTHTLAVEPKEDLEFFRKKTILLEKQISELKQMMLKIQTFAMETSMSLMKYKNGIDIKEQEPIRIGDGTEDEPEDEPEDGPITPTNEEANHHTDDTTKDTLA